SNHSSSLMSISSGFACPISTGSAPFNILAKIEAFRSSLISGNL
ncbi:MAG: hypothetical protein ACI9QC_000671, partial [Oceanicoccus sp.]